jgi:hypothetical protein
MGVAMRGPSDQSKVVEMNHIKSVLAGLAVAGIMATAPFTTAAQQLVTPNSVQLQHRQIVGRLASYAQQSGPIGTAAQKAADFLKAHYAKEEQFVLPPLGLLPALLKNGGASKADMERALEMAQSTKAAMDELYADHVQITALMTELADTANERNEKELVRLATRVAAQSLNDMEVLFPATVLIGEYIRMKLSKDQ